MPTTHTFNQFFYDLREAIDSPKPDIELIRLRMNIYASHLRMPIKREITERRALGGPRYRAQIWANGTVVYLGQFDSIEERDAAVEAAKARRSMGLPVKL